MAVDHERIQRIAEQAADGVRKLVLWTDALVLLKRTADGDPCQLSAEQAEAVIWMQQALVEERRKE